MEELRAIVNNNASKWGEVLKKAMDEVGDGETLCLMRNEGNEENIQSNLERGVIRKAEQEIQSDWGRIDKSKYCQLYKNYKEGFQMGKYWDLKMVKGEFKEQWARLRCGNVGLSGNKGFSNTVCRLCGVSEENLAHIWNCEEGRRLIKRDLVREVDSRLKKDPHIEIEQKLINILKEGLSSELCRYAKEFERLARERERERVIKNLDVGVDTEENNNIEE